MSLDDWKFDRGWRGTIYTLGEFALALVRFGLFLAMVALVLWGGISWLWATFVAPNS